MAEGGYLSIEIDATADGGGSGAEETRWDSEEDRQSTTMGGPEGLAGRDSDPWEAGTARGDTGAWSDAHAVVVLCLILRQCGAADPQIVRLSPLDAPQLRACSDRTSSISASDHFGIRSDAETCRNMPIG